MSLDVGTRRIGVATSDLLGVAAHPHPYILRKSTEFALEEIKRFIFEEQIEILLVGLPKNMDGSLGPSAQSVIDFVDLLKKIIEIPVQYWDERLSTVSAEKLMIEADLSRKKRKQKIDSMAAQIILQNYLDSQ